LSLYSYRSVPYTYTLSLHDALPISLGKRAIDELHLAEDRLRATDAARNAAEAALNKANATLQEFEVALNHTEARIAAAETQLSEDRKSTRLNSSHEWISYAVFCLKK